MSMVISAPFRAQPVGWPTAYGPSRPPMWALGGQPEDVFEDVLEDVLERGLTMSIFLDIHRDHVNILGYPCYRGISVDIHGYPDLEFC